MLPFMTKIKFLFILCLILVITFFAFTPVLRSNFTNWDDEDYVTNNSVIRSPLLISLKKVFGSFYLRSYQPLTILSYKIEYGFFKLNPVGYHTTNLILHLLNCLLVFWLIFKLSRNIFVSFLTAILFGIHPLQVESVAWISERKGLLCTFFLLGSIISYVSYVQKNRAFKYYIFSLSLFVLALLSKGIAIILPVILLLVDYFVFLRRKRVIFRDKIPFFILSLLFIVINLYALYSEVDAESVGSFSILDKIRISSYCVMFYFNKIFIHANLSCVYTYAGGKEAPSISGFLFSLLPILALFATMIISLRYTKFFLAIVLFLVSIFPALQLVPVGRAIVADRYIYFPSIWIFYLLSEFIVWVLGQIRRYKRSYGILKAALIISLFLTLVSLVFITQNRARVWKDSFTLWNEALRVSPSAIANNHLGHAYQKKGDLNTAIAYYTAALHLDPNYFSAYNNRGTAYASEGELEKALIDFNRAIEIRPFNFKAYKNRARLYYLIREYNKSWEDVYAVERLGQKMEGQFMESLKSASGREN